MSHNNKKSLVFQVQENLKSKLAIGESKHFDKICGETQSKIYSFGTYNAYMQQCISFAKFCKKNFGCKTLNDCRAHVDDFLQFGLDTKKSKYTLKLQASSLAKLYDCKTSEFISLPTRKRAEIKRSRSCVNFGSSDLERFCMSCGLRRREVEYLRGNSLIQKDGSYFIEVKNGKGGRHRLAEIIGDVDFVVSKMMAAGEGRVFDKIPANIDIHSMRAYYASKIYRKYARSPTEYRNERVILYKNRVVEIYNSSNGRRDIDSFKKYYLDPFALPPVMRPGYEDVSSVYICRDDKKDKIYDRLALLKCSQSLGHNRASVVACHYLWQ